MNAAECAYWRGMIYSYQDRLIDARKALNAAIQLHPRYAPYHLACALIDNRLNFRRECLTHLQMALGEKETLQRLTMIYQPGDDKHLLALERETMKFPQFYSGLASLYVQFGIDRQALRKLEETAAIRPDCVEILGALRSIHAARHEYSQAVAVSLSALKREPKNVFLHLALSEIYRSQKKFDRAIDELQLVLKYDRNHVWARYLLAQIDYCQGKYSNALNTLSVVCNDDPNNTRLLILQANSFAASGNHQAQLAPALAVLKIDPRNTDALILSGESYLYNGHLNLAIAKLEEAAKLSAHDTRIELPLAAACLRVGQLQRAKALVLAVLAREPHKVPALEMKANVELLAHDYQSLTRTVATILNLDQKNLAARLQLALCHSDQGRPDLSIPLLREVLSLQPNHSDALFMLGRLNPSDASIGIKRFETESQKDPNNVDIHRRLAILYKVAGKDEQSAEQLRTILRLCPDDQTARFDLVKLCKRPADREQAFVQLQAMLKKDHCSAESRLLMAEMLEERKDWNATLEQLRLALKKDPRNLSIHLSKARILSRKQAYDQALASVDFVLKSNPQHVAALGLKADIYLHTQQNDRALQLADLMMKLDPNSIHACLIASSVYEQKKQYAAALRPIKQLLLRHPGDSLLLLRHANLALLIHDLESASASANSILAKEPDNINALLVITNVCELQHNYEKAIETLTKILKIDPHNTDARCKAAHFYLAEDQYGKALTEIERVLSQDPSNSNATLLKADILERQHCVDQALACLASVRKSSPIYAHCLWRQAALNQSLGRTSQALSLALAAAHIEPRNAEGLLFLAHVYAQMKNHQAALNYAQKVLRYRPLDERTLRLTVDLFEANNMHQQAQHNLDLLLKRDPKDKDLITSASIFEKQGLYDQALNRLRKASAKDAPLYCRIANLYNLKKEPRNRLSALQAALAKEPQNLNIKLLVIAALQQLHNNQAAESIIDSLNIEDCNPDLKVQLLQRKAQLAIRKQQIHEAIKLLERAAQIQPTKNVLLNLATVYVEAQEYKVGGDAIMSLLSRYQVDRNEKKLLKTHLAICQAELGLLQQALQSCSEAVAIDPGDSAPRFQRATLLFALGEVDKAKEEFTRLTRINPQTSLTFSDVKAAALKFSPDLSKYLVNTLRGENEELQKELEIIKKRLSVTTSSAKRASLMEQAAELELFHCNYSAALAYLDQIAPPERMYQLHALRAACLFGLQRKKEAEAERKHTVVLFARERLRTADSE